MKKWTGFGILSLALLTTSCEKTELEDGDKNHAGGEDVTVDWGVVTAAEGQPVVLPAGCKGYIPFQAQHLKSVAWEGVPAGWNVTLNTTSDTLWVEAPEEVKVAQEEWTLQVKLTGTSGNEISQPFKFYAISSSSFDDPRGTFVLNEGNMTTENGSLLYITPEGYMVDDVYKLVNGSELGNVCQDMAFHDGKIYIISQNGDKNPVGTEFKNDGMLVVLDAKTLKKVDAYTKEDLEELAWPSHIAVLDEEHVYIRDNGVREGDNGSGKVWRLNTKDRSLVEIKNTLGAPKAPLYVIGDKVYTYNVTESFVGKKMNILQISTSSDQALAYYRSLTGPEVPVSVAPAKEAQTFWVLYKDDLDVYSVAKARLPKYGKMLTLSTTCPLQEEDVPNGGASGVVLVPEKDVVEKEQTVGTFYFSTATCVAKCTYTEGYSGASNTVTLNTDYVAELSDLDEDARLVYNGMAIHPVTGHLYVNTLKGMGTAYLTNSIWEFAIENTTATKVNRWSNYTKFPAGFFFFPENK